LQGLVKLHKLPAESKESKNYLDVLSNIFHSFTKPEAGPVSEKYIQRKACQNMREEELENNVRGK
jgi:hypothetical protein